MKWMMQKILISCIRFYQLTISALTGDCCRFQPTCSEYAHQAIKVHGCFWGTWLSIKRLLKCHPWGKSGYDPVPPKE